MIKLVHEISFKEKFANFKGNFTKLSKLFQNLEVFNLILKEDAKFWQQSKILCSKNRGRRL